MMLSMLMMSGKKIATAHVLTIKTDVTTKFSPLENSVLPQQVKNNYVLNGK
jgi:hypothetical protein